MIAARRLVPAALALFALLLAAYVAKSGGDGRLYWEYGGRLLGRSFVPGYVEWVQHGTGELRGLDAAVPGPALAPYTGFAAEYPPGALLLFEAVRAPVDAPFAYGRAFALLMAACALLLAWSGLRVRALLGGEGGAATLVVAAALLLWPLLVGRGFLVGRFDVVPAVLAIVALLLHARGRPAWGGLLLGIGGVVKLWPLLLVPLLLLDLATRRRWRDAILTAAAGAAGFVVPHLLLLLQGTQVGDLLVYLGYLRDRPAEIESVIASVAMLVHGQAGVSVSRDFGSINLLFAGDRGWIAAASICNALLLVLVYVAFGRAMLVVAEPRARLRLAVAAAGAIAVAMVACSRVYSGEYVIWFFPFALALATTPRRAAALGLYLAALLCLRLMYRHWDELDELGTAAVTFLLLKNLLTLALGAVFLLPLLRLRPALEPGRRARDMATTTEGLA